MEKQALKIRFFLQAATRTIIRNLKDKNRVPGTRQLDCYISWGAKQRVDEVKGMLWQPWPNAGFHELNKLVLPTKYTGSFYNQKKYKEVKNRFGSLRINADSQLIKYQQIKMQTGIFILPDAWDSKNQSATGVYEPLNRIINQWRHVITLTYEELKQRVDFDSTKLVSEIKTRMKNGVPINISIPANATPMDVLSHVARNMDGKSIVDMSNPKGVPTDMRKFILFFNENKLDPKKLSDETIKSRVNLANKLERYFEQTGKILSITESTLQDVSQFMKWRMYDNEVNKARKGHIINPTSGECIGVATMNKVKKLLKFYFDRAADNFECTIKVNTNNYIFKEQQYDREMNDVYLSMEQLHEIFKLDLNGNERMKKHRSLFLLGCLGGGYRVEDLHKIHKPILEKYDNGKQYYTFHVVSTKTKTRTAVPIPHELNAIVEEYDFDTPVKIHDFRDDIKDLGKLCGWKDFYSYNEELADGSSKPVSKPFFDMMMPRTCRKTFCSLLYNFYGLTVQEASAFSGHNSDEFLKYLQIDKKVKAQQLANKFEVKPIFQS